MCGGVVGAIPLLTDVLLPLVAASCCCWDMLLLGHAPCGLRSCWQLLAFLRVAASLEEVVCDSKCIAWLLMGDL